MRQAVDGPYEITALLPLPDDGGSPRYRMKSKSERHERVVPETELMPPVGQDAVAV
jgi:hypothetical protein